MFPNLNQKLITIIQLITYSIIKYAKIMKIIPSTDKNWKSNTICIILASKLSMYTKASHLSGKLSSKLFYWRNKSQKERRGEGKK